MPSHRTVVLLSPTSHCYNAQSVAYYLDAAPRLKMRIRLYNYRTQQLYSFDPNNISYVDIGKHSSSFGYDQSLFERVCDKLDINTQAGEAPISPTTFKKMRRYTHISDHMTTMNPLKLADFKSSAVDTIDMLMKKFGDKGNQVCFMIPPNGRNIPARFLTVGHRFRISDDGKGMYFIVNSKKIARVDHLVMKNDQVANVMTEAALCQAIYLGKQRYVGCCYGAQVMWLSLGGGIATHAIEKASVPHKDTLIVKYPKSKKVADTAFIDIDGMCYTNTTTHDKAHPCEYLDSELLYHLFGKYMPPLTYNTDFNHCYMMILSKFILQYMAHLKYPLTIKEHPLAYPVRRSMTDKTTSKQAHIQRLQRHASKATELYKDDKRSSDDKKKKRGRIRRTTGWVGLFGVNRRITCFQDHPTYHPTGRSASWGETPTVEGDTTAANLYHRETEELLELAMFGTHGKFGG